MAKRIYMNIVKKYGLKVGLAGGTLVGLLFVYLMAIGSISNVSWSPDTICTGTEQDPCYAYINFTANEDIFIYPLDYDPYDRNVGINFDPNVKSWKLERSWGKGWREIPLNETCKGTWCGGKYGTRDNVYSYAFREGRDYQMRITVLKINPNDNVKWSAFSVDPTFFGLNNKSLKKEYNSLEREISFNSKIDNSNEFKIKLETELVHYVLRGKDKRVAITNIENNYGNYPLDLILKSVEFSNVDTGEIFERDFHYEYKKSIGFKTVNDYGDEICVTQIGENSSEITNCVRFIEGTHQEEQFEWVNLNISKDMSRGNLTIALVTDVLPNEKVEWIPVYMGIRSEEFAGWEESWNVGLVAYYKLDRASGSVVDEIGNHDGLNFGAATRNQPGQINKSFFFVSGESDGVNISDELSFPQFTSAVTISLWGNWSSTGTKRGVGLAEDNAMILGVSGGGIGLEFGNTFDFAGTPAFNLGQWYHLVGVWNGTFILFYLDGVFNDSTASSVGDKDAIDCIGCWGQGPSQYMDGQLDEVFISNRTWSASEISDLYDAQKDGFINGSYTTVFNIAPTTTLSYPVDNANFSTSSVTFSIIPQDAEDATGLNVSLYHNHIAWGVNQTNSSALNNSQTNFTTSFPDGIYIWNGLTIDSGGFSAFATSNRTFIVDTTNPLISYVSPTEDNDTTFDRSWIYVNVSITEPNRHSITYVIFNSSGEWNSTVYTTSQDFINWTGLSDGTYYYNVTVNDTFGNENSTATRWINLQVNTKITLNSPIDFFNSSLQTIDFNGTIIDLNGLTNVSLYGNWSGWHLNTTNSSGINNTDYLFTNIIAEGIYVWGYHACDSLDNCVFSSNRTFTVDTPPIITVFSPLNQSYSTQTIYFNATADEAINTWIVNYNGTNVTITINTTLVVESGSHQAIFYANDSVGFGFGVNDSIYFTVPTLSINLSFEGIYSNITAELASITINASTNLDTICVDIHYPRFGINYTCEFLSNIFEFNPSFIRQNFTNTSNFAAFNFSNGRKLFNLSVDSHQYDEPDNLSINITGTNNPFDVIIFYLNTTPDISNTTQFNSLTDRLFHGFLNGPVIYLNKFSDENTTKNLTYQTGGEKTVYFILDDIIDKINTDFTFFLNISGFPFGINFKDGDNTAGVEGFNNYSNIDTSQTTAHLDISGVIMPKNVTSVTYYYDDFDDASINTSLWIVSNNSPTIPPCTSWVHTVTESGGNIVVYASGLTNPSSGSCLSVSDLNSLDFKIPEPEKIEFSITYDGSYKYSNTDGKIGSGTMNINFDSGSLTLFQLSNIAIPPSGDSTQTVTGTLNFIFYKVNKTFFALNKTGNITYTQTLFGNFVNEYDGNTIYHEAITSTSPNFEFEVSSRGSAEGNEAIGEMTIHNITQELWNRQNSTVTSNSIYDASSDISSATLWISGYRGTGIVNQSIETYMSADDGDNWETVGTVTGGTGAFPLLTSGLHTFTDTGKNLRWKVDFNSTDWNVNDTSKIYQINITIPSGNPENITIDFGADGTTDFTFTGQLNSTNLQKQVNLSFVDISSSFISSNLGIKPSGNNYEHTYLIPLNISSESIGTITMEAINLTYDPNPVVLNITNLTKILGNSTNFTTFRIPISAKNSTTENYSIVTVDDLKYDYAGGNFSVNITAHDSNYLINITREIFFYYSRWDFKFVSNFISFLEFIPPSPSSKNVTPFGQSSWPNSKPILNITNYGYGGIDADLSIYLNDTFSCVNLTMSITENKTGGSIINDSWLNLSLSTSYLETTSIYMWADYDCSFNNFTLWQPYLFFRQCAEGVNFCSEDVD